MIVEDGWPPSRAAAFYNVSWRTAAKWAQRYCCDEGLAGMTDRSSARLTQHAKTPQPTVHRIVRLRRKQRLGPVEIGARLGVPASTVHAALVMCRLNRLSHIDRVTGEPARRYERSRPGS
ncbi:helix-turn-helix domain-containing protein [Pimelobacter simplex]|nr:helix-turn-helix domain-containing protein [Pimelobacter simplex]